MRRRVAASGAVAVVAAPDGGTTEARSPAVAQASRPGRIRILHVISTLLRGGTEMAMLHLIKGLDPTCYEFRVAYLRDEAPLAPEVEAATGSPVAPIGLRAKFDPAALLRLRAYVRRERIDLVHTHMDLADYYGAAAARLGGARGLVSTKHNADEFRTRRTWKRYPFLALERLAYEAADRVVAVSNGLADFLVARQHLPRRKLIVIGNGVDPALGDRLPSRDALRRELGFTAFQPLLGCVGRLEPQKGHIYLLRAFPGILRRHPGAGLVIAGDGPLRDDLQRAAARLGIDSRVLFLGYRSDVPQILAALDQFVLPSLWEGLSKALLEAMALGCPIVAARAVGVEEVVRDRLEGLLVPPTDVAALGAAIDELGSDHRLGRRLGEAARRSVAEGHSMAAVAARFDRLYREILGREL